MDHLKSARFYVVALTFWTFSNLALQDLLTAKLQKVLRNELEATLELKSTFKSRIGALEQVHTRPRDSFYRVSLAQPQLKTFQRLQSTVRI